MTQQRTKNGRDFTCVLSCFHPLLITRFFLSCCPIRVSKKWSSPASDTAEAIVAKPESNCRQSNFMYIFFANKICSLCKWVCVWECVGIDKPGFHDTEDIALPASYLPFWVRLSALNLVISVTKILPQYPPERHSIRLNLFISTSRIESCER